MRAIYCCLLAFVLTQAACAGTAQAKRGVVKVEGVFDAKSYGAKGDGRTDDTAAIQKAMDAASRKGGAVYLPPAKYLIKGSLRVPVGVTLKGAAQSPQYIEPLIGTVILATGGRDKEEAPALFEMGDSSAVMGLTIYYPEQKLADIHPYAWTFHLKGGDNTVENVTLINSYNAIRIGPEVNMRHRILSVYGCALRRGILLDCCVDIGRIENVHFHCHWWSSKAVGGDFQKVREYMWSNCEAFVFGRTDWEYVTNTFVFPAKVGYRFVQTKNGAMNGQLSGIGCDEGQRCVVVEAIQSMGLLITNGQFVTVHGDDPTELVIEATSNGSVRLVNCSFWGLGAHNVVSHGQGFLSLSSCYFSTWRKTDSPKPLIEADNGKLQITNCTFGTDQPSVLLKKGLKHAIVTQNNGSTGVDVVNEIGDLAIIRDNEARK